jgi:hypothetical protein
MTARIRRPEVLKIKNTDPFPLKTFDVRLDRDTVEDQIAFWLYLFRPSWKRGKNPSS